MNVKGIMGLAYAALADAREHLDKAALHAQLDLGDKVAAADSAERAHDRLREAASHVATIKATLRREARKARMAGAEPSGDAA